MILKGDISRVGHLKSLFGVIVGDVVFNRAGIVMHQCCCFIASWVLLGVCIWVSSLSVKTCIDVSLDVRVCGLVMGLSTCLGCTWLPALYQLE